jgi:hypothetical protein
VRDPLEFAPMSTLYNDNNIELPLSQTECSFEFRKAMKSSRRENAYPFSEPRKDITINRVQWKMCLAGETSTTFDFPSEIACLL